MLGHGESMSNLILDLHHETKEECALNMRVGRVKKRYDIFHRRQSNRGFEFNAGFITKEVEPIGRLL